MSVVLTRAVRAFGLVVSIETDAPDLFDLLGRQLPEFPLATPDDAGPVAADLAYRVTVRAGRGVGVVRGRRTIAIVQDVPAACERIVTDLQSAMARRAAGCIFIHAGVVAIDGEALLLPARSRAGKSTLVAALLRAGAGYGSDEFAVIDPAGRVHPYSRQLALRTDASVSRVRADALGAAVLTRSLPVAAVVFTEFRAGAPLRLQPLSAGEVVLRLLQHGLGVRGRPDETMAALGALAQAARGFAGERGEAGFAAALLIDRARHGWLPIQAADAARFGRQ